MMKPLLSLLLILQLFLSQALPLYQSEPTRLPPREDRLMWGLIDPEMSAWFALLPAEGDEDAEAPILWDWSWRGFLASIFGDLFLKEAAQHDAHL